MHCGVMVTGYNQGDWDWLLKGEYNRPPAVSDAQNMLGNNIARCLRLS